MLGIAFVAAVLASALPDNPYQRWQLVEDTLFSNATWSYERIHFDPRPVDIAIIGSSRSQIGLSAPRIAARLASLGARATVANMSVIEDGRNIEWAIVDELFKVKRPKLLVVLVNEDFSHWGHPGFKYVAPAAAVALPPVPFLHNSLYDITYLPFRQLKLFAANAAPRVFGLRKAFDPVRYAERPVDYSISQVLPDGKFVDMDATHAAGDLEEEARAYAATSKPSQLPSFVTDVTDRDNQVYVTRIARLAAAHHARLLFVLLPKFASSTKIEGMSFYAGLGQVENYGDLGRNPDLFQSFAHLNHAGAMIASDRVALAALPYIVDRQLR